MVRSTRGRGVAGSVPWGECAAALNRVGGQKFLLYKLLLLRTKPWVTIKAGHEPKRCEKLPLSPTDGRGGPALSF